MKVKSILTNSTALTSYGAMKVAQSNANKEQSQGISISNVKIVGFGTAIRLHNRLAVPAISSADIKEIEKDQPEFITRHIERRWLESNLSGYFHFGTLFGYQAIEGTAAGRLGDRQESVMQDVFNSASGIIDEASLPGLEVRNLILEGAENHIVAVTKANDYCACASIGRYNKSRGILLQDNEADPERRPGAYVTYHLPSLRAAILKEIALNSDVRKPAIVGRSIFYGNKDVAWAVERRFRFKREKDALCTWLNIAFTKSPSFKHEEEYRILLVNPSSVGCLSESAKPIVISESSAISSAIVDYGEM